MDTSSMPFHATNATESSDMKGFIVWLIPLNPSGIQRNKDFLKSNKGKLVGGGKAQIQEDGRLKCTWRFENDLPDMSQKQMLNSFTQSLDEAIAKKTNVRYEVEFIP